MTTDKSNIPDTGYVFNIDYVDCGFVYFSTFTAWCDTVRQGREKREPDIINTEVMAKALEDLGHYLYIVKSDDDLKCWLSKEGWAIVSEDFCKRNMSSWLKPKICLKTPTNTYIDVSKVPQSRQKRQTTRFREEVLKRDGNTCLLCGKTEKDGTAITMHHIRPFSKGGETALRNLMALCNQCNQNIADNFLSKLYEQIGVSYGYDRGLLKSKLDLNTWTHLMQMSDNLMHTRCEHII